MVVILLGHKLDMFLRDLCLVPSYLFFTSMTSTYSHYKHALFADNLTIYKINKKIKI